MIFVTLIFYIHYLLILIENVDDNIQDKREFQKVRTSK